MKTQKLIKDPVFQLNLLLWMSKEQPPDNYRIRPVFFDLGYKIIYIEQPFAFPESTLNALADSHLDIIQKPEPEVIIGKTSEKKALYFEAKANAFDYGSSNSKQARAHLVACGPAFGEVYGPLNSCLLCYLVPGEGRDRMSGCLRNLTEELKKKGLQPGLFSSHGLALTDNKIIYSWDKSFKEHMGIDKDDAAIMSGLEEDTDPSPLVLLFSDEDCSNTENRDFYRRVVLDQVRACLLCDLHSLPLNKSYEATPSSLLLKTTDGVFQYLGRQRQKGLSQLIRAKIFDWIYSNWKVKQPGIELNGERITFTWNNMKEKEEFLDWLEGKRMKYDAGKSGEDQLMLFTNIKDNKESK
ncbi:MAG: hypothetical protein QG657_1449 [Acidobacteriota bacterium]|nr:hypothetical protein [Acidobacteriota bacterium]